MYMHMCMRMLLYIDVNVHVAFTVTETASITSDNRNVHDANKSELHQRNIYAPLPFHTECEEQINKGKL